MAIRGTCYVLPHFTSLQSVMTPVEGEDVETWGGLATRLRLHRCRASGLGVPPPTLPLVKGHGLPATLHFPQILPSPLLVMSALSAGKFTVLGPVE